MPAENPVKSIRKPRILVSPLDWGLGHAARCIPIIHELLLLDCDVWIASDGGPKKILKEEFPALPILDIPGYNIRYAKSQSGFPLRMMMQVPKILDIISYENVWLKSKNPAYEFDAVISDNRYGFRHTKVFSVFITHQLNIKTGLGGFIDWLVRRFNYGYIKKFDACWIADDEKEKSLAGDLSFPKKRLPKPFQYTGLLSRLKKTGIEEIKNHLLVIISGPEPQRTIFENIIVKEIAHYSGTATVVRGLPGSESLIPSTNTIKFYNHLPAADMNEEMEKAEFVISRSGYSTIMDIARLNKKSILVPTPGQTEQEYLATRLSKNKQAIQKEQRNFPLIDSIAEANAFSFQPFPEYDGTQLKKTVADFVKQLEAKISHSG